MKIEHANREHALLSASSSSKWLVCTPSARLEEQIPEEKSEYADEGRLAHEISELKLRKYFIEPMGPQKFSAQMKKLKEDPLYQEEMQRHTDTYVEYVQNIVHGFKSPPYVAIEKKLDYSAYAPEGFGTSDSIIISGNVLYLIDFKYGKGHPVSAVNNSQMRLYALGAYQAYSFLYQIETVKMAIVQPRLDDISEDEISITELLEWGESIKSTAQMAFNGEGEYAPGEHCKFCRAKATCRARVEQFFQLEDYHMMKPPLVSNTEIGQILERAQNIASWVKSLQDYALAECLKGNEVTGWKAVEGRSNRNYVDLDKAFEHLKSNEIAEVMLYKNEPLTVAQVEELLGKKEYKRLLEEPGHVKKSPGKPTLAPASDKREAITNKIKPEDVFTNEE